MAANDRAATYRLHREPGRKDSQVQTCAFCGARPFADGKPGSAFLALGLGLVHQRQQSSNLVGFDLHHPQVAVETTLPFQKSGTFLAIRTGKARFEAALGADVLVIGETLRRGPIEVLAAIAQALADKDRPCLLRPLFSTAANPPAAKTRRMRAETNISDLRRMGCFRWKWWACCC